MRWFKIGGVILAVLVLLMVAAGLALYLGGGRAVAWALEHPGSALIGRQIRVGGPVSVSWQAGVRITIDDLAVANAPWGTAKEMLRARQVAITVDPWSLLRGPTRVPTLRLDGARLMLETSANGEGNWTFPTGAPKQRGAFPILQKFEAHDSALVYRNGVTKAETDLGVGTLELDAPDPAARVKIAGTGTFQHQPIRVNGTVGPLAALRDTRTPYPVTLDLALAELRMTFDGTIAEPLDFAGLNLRFSLRGTGLDKLGDALGVPLPDLPPVRGTSVLAGGNGAWRIDAITLKVGRSDLEGGIHVDTNEKVPRIDANLTSSRIALGDFKGVYGGKPATPANPKPRAPGGRVLPDTQLEVYKLPGINATLAFYGTRIEQTAGVPFEAVTLVAKIENGELVIDPLRFHVALGDLDIAARYNHFTERTPPRVQGRVDIRHIDLHKLLSGPDMPEIARKTAGIVGGMASFDASGASLHQIMASMNGKMAVFVANGQMSALLARLAPLDVLGALGVYVSGDRPVPINCFISRFVITGGIARSTTMLLRTPATTIVGTGGVNFANEAIALDLKPYNNNFTPLSLHTPLQVRGTLGQPTYHLQKENLIERLGAAVGLGILFPPAALLPLIDTGLGPGNACQAAYGAAPQPAADGGPRR